VQGGRWISETHSFTSVPLYLRPGGVVPLGPEDVAPEQSSVTGLLVSPDAARDGDVTVSALGATFTVRRDGDALVIAGPSDRAWDARLPGGEPVAAVDGRVAL